MPRPKSSFTPPADKLLRVTLHKGRLELALRSLQLESWHGKDRNFYGQRLVRPKPSYPTDSFPDVADYAIVSWEVPIAFHVPGHSPEWNFTDKDLNPPQKLHLMVLEAYLVDPDEIPPFVTSSGELPLLGKGKWHREKKKVFSEWVDGEYREFEGS